MGSSTAPLVQALEVVGQSGMAMFLNWAGLFGLVASFFSLVYAGSRQMFALSRAGYLPRSWALTGKRKTPVLVLLIQGIVGFGLAVLVQSGDTLINVAVFGACTSYALMNLSHILLRRREPEMHRGYRTPGGARDKHDRALSLLPCSRLDILCGRGGGLCGTCAARLRCPVLLGLGASPFGGQCTRGGVRACAQG